MHAKVLKAIHAVNVYCKAHNYDTQLIHEWKVYAILNGVKSSATVSYPVFSVWFLKTAVTIGCDNPCSLQNTLIKSITNCKNFYIMGALSKMHPQKACFTLLS